MKKVLMLLLGILCVVAFLFGCSETSSGDINIAWTISCFAVSFLSGWLVGVIGDREARKNA